MLKEQKKYTIVLLYPDYATDDYGTDTYMAWVKAADIDAALRRATAQASRANGGEDPINPDDFEALVAYRGWLKSLV